MKKWTRILSYFLTVCASAAVTAAICFSLLPGRSKLDELSALIDARFIGDADETAMLDAAADAMVGALGDRWSYYIPASDYAAYSEQMSNRYVGIGITISPQETSGGIPITAVTKGGPAEEAGVQPGDVILSVNGQSVSGMSTSDLRTQIRGEAGSSVQLTLLRGSETLALSVLCREIDVPVATGTMCSATVGLVTIENFDSRCASEAIACIESLREQGAASLVFDVRNNPGGYASELVKLLDYLLPEGELFRTVDYLGRENVDYSDASCLDIPMAVLVNGSSYSAAEFFAAALREYDAAVVVGEQTCGKGYFQQTYRLKDGSAVGLSVGEYFTPHGKNLAGVGITPDLAVSVDADTAAAIAAGTCPLDADAQLQAAIAALG